MQPKVRLGLILRLVEMIQGFVRVLDGTERALDLALAARGHAPSVRAGGQVRHQPDAEAIEYALKYPALGDRTVVAVDGLRDALHDKAAVVRFGSHGVEQEAQRRFNVFTVDAAILLVGNARAIVHDAVEHQGGRAPAGITPERLRDVLEVGRAQIELPQFVGASRLESHRRWPTCQSHVVIAPLAQVAIDCGSA